MWSIIADIEPMYKCINTLCEGAFLASFFVLLHV